MRRLSDGHNETVRQHTIPSVFNYDDRDVFFSSHLGPECTSGHRKTNQSSRMHEIIGIRVSAPARVFLNDERDRASPN